MYYRCSHWRCSSKNGVLKNFAKFTGKHMCQSLFFNKVAWDLQLKRWLWHRGFLLNFAKCLRTTFLQNTSERLLLNPHVNLTHGLTWLRNPEWKKKRKWSNYFIAICCRWVFLFTLITLIDSKWHDESLFLFAWMSVVSFFKLCPEILKFNFWLKYKR